ncbi:MAG: hypothetical protein RL758_37 [Pseudomonadota bacterium]|jgi:hypothetical protein
MRHDIFDFHAEGMTPGDRAWRVIFLLAVIAACAYDLFVGRPG